MYYCHTVSGRTLQEGTGNANTGRGEMEFIITCDVFPLAQDHIIKALVVPFTKLMIIGVLWIYLAE